MAKTARTRKAPASTRLTPAMDKRISELMEIQNDNRSGVLRRVIKLGLADYDMQTDFLLREFVERWRKLSEPERQTFIGFAEVLAAMEKDNV